MSRDHCLILTNLEYTENPSAPPLEKRIFPRNFRQSMVRTDRMIRTRWLTDIELARINHVLKARAQRHIAAGKHEWLYPERHVSGSWADLAATLLPPRDELWHHGGETNVGFEDCSVRHQNAYGGREGAGSSQEGSTGKGTGSGRALRLRVGTSIGRLRCGQGGQSVAFASVIWSLIAVSCRSWVRHGQGLDSGQARVYR